MKQMNFTANRWKFTILPVAIILIGLVFLLINKGFNYDIEFMGGVRMQVELGTTYENDELAKLIKEKNNVKNAPSDKTVRFCRNDSDSRDVSKGAAPSTVIRSGGVYAARSS